MTLIVYDGSTCGRTIFLLGISSVVGLSLLGQIDDMCMLTGLVTCHYYYDTMHLENQGCVDDLAFQRPETCIDILALHGADDFIDLTNVTNGWTRSGGRTSGELVTQ